MMPKPQRIVSKIYLTICVLFIAVAWTEQRAGTMDTGFAWLITGFFLFAAVVFLVKYLRENK